MRVLFVAIGACALTGGAAGAQDYPDMRGTWTGTSDAVFVGTAAYYQQGTTPAEFGSSPVEVRIDQQEGRRFAGAVTIENWTKPLVAIFSSDTTIIWAEPGGAVEARLVDSDTLDYCYLRSAQYQQVAACAELKRQD